MKIANVLTTMRHRLPVILTLVLVGLVAAALGYTYVGSTAGPYGMCEAANGQQVACATLKAAQR